MTYLPPFPQELVLSCCSVGEFGVVSLSLRIQPRGLLIHTIITYLAVAQVARESGSVGPKLDSVGPKVDSVGPKVDQR